MGRKWPGSLSDRPTVLYEKSLRSGQNVSFDGNVVILGDVNAGAEVVATGHILVMGSLRGLVHAGARGDEDATVTALQFAPTQLRIASHITRPPEDGGNLGDKTPETARIKGDMVVIEDYQPPK